MGREREREEGRKDRGGRERREREERKGGKIEGGGRGERERHSSESTVNVGKVPQLIDGYTDGTIQRTSSVY